MKKILTILLSMLLLVGCNSSKIKTAVDKAITDYKTSIDAKMKQVATEDGSAEALYTSTFMSTIYDFDYEVKSIEEKDDTASATVIIKTMNINDLLTAYGADQEVINAGEKLKTEEDETKIIEYVNILNNKLVEYAKNTKKDYEADVVIPLVKEDGNWVIDPTYELSSNLSAAILASAIEEGN